MKAAEISPEHAVARRGDWPYDPSLIGHITAFILERNWSMVGHLAVADGDVLSKDYDIYRHNSSLTFAVGEMQPLAGPTKDNSHIGKQEFGRVLSMQMSAVKNMSFRDKGAALGYSNLHNVNGVSVRIDQRGYGIAVLFYKWLITQGMSVLGDREQYFGARRLWAALSRDISVIVDIVDFEKLVVIERNVTLHQGQFDADFDKRVWSYGEDIQHVRLVLRGIEP